MISFLLLALSLLASTPGTDVQAPTPPNSVKSGSDSAYVRADSVAAADSVTASRLRVAQDAWDKGSNAASKDAPASLSAGSLAGGLFQVLSGLAFLVLIAVAGLFVLRRVRGRSATARNGSLIDILETAPAGPGRQICLVRIHDRVVAVAFANASVASVAEFTGTSAAEILADSGNGRTLVRDFSATLDSFMDRFRKQPPPEDKR